MPSGQLRELVTLQAPDTSVAPNSYNERPDAWTDLLVDYPASVQAISGREFNAVQQVQASATHRVVIRTPHAVEVRPEHRFVWIERLIAGTEVTHYLDIKHAVPLVKRRGYTECMCTEHLGG